jgi:peptide/nickel transport system permease protein
VSNYILTRLVGIVPTMLVLLFMTVLLVRILPGNAVDILLTQQKTDNKATREQLEAKLGLDKSIPEEFVSYTAGALRGDLGRSLWSNEGVTGMIIGKLGITLELAFLALAIGTSLGITLGVISALWPNSLLDYVLRSLSILGLSVPSFALASLVIVLPVLWWQWSPPISYTPASEGLWQHISQFFTPAALLGIGLAATLMRLTRTTMLEVQRQDYIRTARAKGLGGYRVVYRHALRNALIPVVSLLGLQVAFILSGSVLLEQIFGLPGMGRLLLSAIGQRDYPVVQGVAVIAGLWVILVNLLVDLSYGVLDPRIRVG